MAPRVLPLARGGMAVQCRLPRVHLHNHTRLGAAMKNITLSADESLIEAARAQAQSENTTLNQQFRIWLASYAKRQQMARYEAVMKELRGKVVLGRKFTRDEMNER